MDKNDGKTPHIVVESLGEYFYNSDPTGAEMPICQATHKTDFGAKFSTGAHGLMCDPIVTKYG